MREIGEQIQKRIEIERSPEQRSIHHQQQQNCSLRKLKSSVGDFKLYTQYTAKKTQHNTTRKGTEFCSVFGIFNLIFIIDNLATVAI